MSGLQAFEKDIFKASTRQLADGEANIFMCKGLVVLYRSQDETTFYVVGSDDENEVILVVIHPAPLTRIRACCAAFSHFSSLFVHPAAMALLAQLEDSQQINAGVGNR